MPDATLELTIDRPVPGGRMLAAHDGRVVLVAGAIPGERVRARVERVAKSVIWATVEDVIEASPDRRPTEADPACGGCHYAHIAYGRQLALKSEVIADAFRRIGRHVLDRPTPVAGSAEHGYRLRARFHVAGGRAGFFREGSHSLCDAGPTGQLLPASIEAVSGALLVLGDRASACSAVVLAENLPATERVLHFEVRHGARLDDPALADRLAGVGGVTGMTAGRRAAVLTGSATVTDTAAGLFGGRSPIGELAAWTRHATSFFQGNRFLTGALAQAVLDATASCDEVVDLYAGVGLFAVALAARGASVVAVEGDASSGADLASNAGPWRERLRVVCAPVEAALAQDSGDPPDAVVLDPPRTGVSAEALGRLIAWRAPRLVYVSCDPPTLARDAARLFTAGYRLASIAAFDLFPNTPHVETLAVFDLA